MQVIINLPFAVMLAGLLLFLLSKDGKRVQLGDRMFFAGLLAYLLLYSQNKVFHF